MQSKPPKFAYTGREFEEEADGGQFSREAEGGEDAGWRVPGEAVAV